MLWPKRLLTIAFKGLVKNRMRSLLTTLGVIIGVASVIVMVGIGAGAQADVEKQISSLGSNMIMIFPDWRRAHGVSQGAESRPMLTMDDAEKLREDTTLLTGISAVVRSGGQVIGVDMNDDMLALARKYQAEMAARLGSDRVRFVKGYIQDLALDIDALGQYLAANPVRQPADYSALKAWEKRQRREAPLIPDASVDLVISNCVLNLVADSEKRQLVREIFRVLRPGGRIAISDIVSDQAIPESMKQDPDLWSGCISGAFEESEFANAFAAAGFSGVCYDKRDPQPWQVIGDITFRSVTLTAVKPVISKEDSDSHTLMYRGPFAAVIDENGRRFVRGSHEAVTAGTRQLLLSAAFGDAFIDLSHDMATGTAGSCCDTARSVNLAEPEGQAASHGGCCA